MTRHLLFSGLCLILLTALLAPGCALLSGEQVVRVPGRPAGFSHAAHADEELALFCSDCHRTVEDQAGAGMPGFEQCLACHPADERTGEAASELSRFLVGGEGPVWTTGAEIELETAFSHALHYEARVACDQCHQGVEESDAVPASVAVGMADCVACHEKREVDAGGCLGCHDGVDTAWAPPSHGEGWERAHGRVWRAGGGLGRPQAPASDCRLCHDGVGEAPSCESCHAERPPSDHSSFFRNRGHGMLALADQRRCNACHQEDTCLECHLEQRPASHGAGFGAPADRHCLGCHFGTQQARACAVCHLDGPQSHSRAPAPPPTVPAHATATSCLTCHSTVKRPKHPYTGDGDYCRRCHQ
ncbi:MAG: cytochrome c3 family protein [Planctomycetes bacterium]|nr:cytochrome c3 family protein [Planctomycetota bacterium]